jgi:hypothetical protein
MESHLIRRRDPGSAECSNIGESPFDLSEETAARGRMSDSSRSSHGESCSAVEHSGAQFWRLRGQADSGVNAAPQSSTCSRGYLASKSVNSSVAFAQRNSSICLDTTIALAFNAPIFKLSGCNFSSSSIRSLNETNSLRSCSISALSLSPPIGFQALRALTIFPPCDHAHVSEFLWQ